MKYWLFLAALGSGLAAAQTMPVATDFSLCTAVTDPAKYTPDNSWALVSGQGKDGWLFGRANFDNYNSTPDKIQPIKNFSDTLKSRGVTLVVIGVPPRGVLASKHIPAGAPWASDLQKVEQSYNAWVSGLEAAGVLTVNVASAVKADTSGNEMAFTQDHHWSPYASLVAAESIGKMLTAKGLTKNIPELKIELSKKPAEAWGSYQGRVNDLCGLKLPPQKYQSLVSVNKTQSLLGDEQPEIVLVGTSNSYRKSGAEESFGAALRYALQRDVQNSGIDGGGPFAALETYLLSKEFADGPAKVLIWQMDFSYDLGRKLPMLTPMVKGECASPSALKFDGQGVAILPTDLTKTSYIIAKMKNAATNQVALKYTFGNKTTKDVSLTHEPKTIAPPVFFGEIPQGSVTVATQVSSDGTYIVCK